MLNAGLIGLGPEWEHRYKPALAKLRRRLRVTCVHSAVVTHAEQVAVELQSDVAPGLVALIERDDVKALLVLDSAWYPGVPAQLACEAGKPAFLAGRLVPRLPIADQLLRRAAESGVTLMPDFAHRYTPTTSRLRELVATRLGRPLSLLVDVAAPFDHSTDATMTLPVEARDLLTTTIDWCTNVVGTAPAAVRAAAQASTDKNLVPNSNETRLQLEVEFRRPAAGGQAALACIRLNGVIDQVAANSGGDRVALGLQARVQCAEGTVWIQNTDHLKWESGTEQKQESLASDRPDVEVMLDHFTRRVVGGLLPIPTLEDLCRAYRLIEMAVATKPG
jgi:predicted dehydrogenase